MRVDVEIGSCNDFRLSRALLLYGKSSYDGIPYRHPFVTVHDVRTNGGLSELGPATLVTPSMLADIVLGLGFTIPTEVLPENVIVRGTDTIAWWTPAKTRALFFKCGSQEPLLRMLNGKRYPHPPLLFKARGSDLWVRALKNNQRPTADTELCMAPYWNTYKNAVVCLGTSKIPKNKRVEQIAEWEESFFASEFTHSAGNSRSVQYEGGFLRMWQSLQEKRRFPVRYLRPLKQTLKEFVDNCDASYRNNLADTA